LGCLSAGFGLFRPVNWARKAGRRQAGPSSEEDELNMAFFFIFFIHIYIVILYTYSLVKNIGYLSEYP
jgi:hypothetical protein